MFNICFIFLHAYLKMRPCSLHGGFVLFWVEIIRLGGEGPEQVYLGGYLVREYVIWCEVGKVRFRKG